MQDFAKSKYKCENYYMQTFLPYKNFIKSAKCLDYKRLGKQRVEALQIHNIISGKRTTGGWINHPVVKMWTGYDQLLAYYHNTMIITIML